MRFLSHRKASKPADAWYILTNCLIGNRNKIVRIYYRRFEIEGSFKDGKYRF